ncbi:MAG: UDP-2,3-diacylglucosamine diphosphatase LpxI [Alphaproteobacteria bacterium]|nr:UDP-2,3-diacylglucosamine diphosphatase LpxI [Alphaproteobacteria bacterium]
MTGKLGIVAGGGDLPLRVAEAARLSQRPYFILGLEGQAKHGCFDDLPHAWVRMGAFAEGIRLLREAQVRELVFVGTVRRPSLAELRPDAYATKVLSKSILRRGDDGLLRTLMEYLERELDVSFVGPDDLLGDLLAQPGQYGIHGPDENAMADIARGVDVASALGALDVGQSVVVQGGTVLGLEAAEGTDQLISRCEALGWEGLGGVLVKLAKPQQDRRADLPAIGKETIIAAAKAGLSGIAIEAGATLVLDRDEMIAVADEKGLFIIGLRRDDFSN